MHEPSWTLRSIDPTLDAAAVVRLSQANEAHWSAMGLDRQPQTEHDVEAWLAQIQPHGEVYGWFTPDGACLSFVGVQPVRVNPSVNPSKVLGVWYGLDKSHEGRGVATQGVRAALRHHLANFPVLERLTIHVRGNNRKSARLALRLGFERDEAWDYRRHNHGRSVWRMEAYTVLTHAWLLRQAMDDLNLSTSTVSPPTEKSGRHVRRSQGDGV